MNTTNKSFLEVQHLLEMKGVEDNLFMMSLLNPNLLDVDIEDPKLDMETDTSIIFESRNNIWYLLREVLKVPKMGGGFEPVNINIAKLAQLFLYLQGYSTWVTAPRQTGSTTFTNIISTLHTKDKNPLIVARDLSDSTVAGSICSPTKCHDTLLWHLKTKKARLYTQLSLGIINNRFFAFDKDLMTNASPEQMKQIAQLPISSIHFTDAEYVENIDNIYYRLRENGFNGPFLFESVINDDADKTGALTLLEKECVEWTTSMFDMPPQDKSKIYHIQYDYEELGYKEAEWFERMVKVLNNDWDVIRREVLLQRK